MVTAGGIHGRIREVKDDVFSIDIAPNTYISVDKASVFPAEAPAAKGKETPKVEKKSEESEEK